MCPKMEQPVILVPGPDQKKKSDRTATCGVPGRERLDSIPHSLYSGATALALLAMRLDSFFMMVIWGDQKDALLVSAVFRSRAPSRGDI